MTINKIAFLAFITIAFSIPKSYSEPISSQKIQLPHVQSVTDIVFLPATKPRLLATSRDDGLLESDDGGLSWQKSTVFPEKCAGNIIRHPSVTALFITPGRWCNWVGLKKSDDRGKSWSDASIGLSVRVEKLLISRQRPNILYAYREEGDPSLFISQDSAASWQPVTLPWQASNDLLDYLIDPIKPDVHYALVRESSLQNRAVNILYRSDNNGVTWSQAITEATSHLAIALSPWNPDEIYAIADFTPLGMHSYGDKQNTYIKLLHSKDRGQQWTQLSTLPNIEGFCGERFTLEIFTPQLIFTQQEHCQRNVHRSTDGGLTWQPNFNSNDYRLSKVISPPFQKDMLYAVVSNQVLISANQGKNWSNPQDFQLKASPAMQLDSIFWSNYRSDDGGQFWYPLRNHDGQKFNVIIPASTTNNQTLYAISNKGVLFHSEDAGLNWLERPAFFEQTRQVLGGVPYISPHDPNLLFIWHDQRIYRSDNGGKNWQETTGLPVIYGYQIRFHPQNSNHMYLVVSSVKPIPEFYFASHDKGLTWQKVATKPKYPLRLLCDPTDPQHCFARIRVNDSIDAPLFGLFESLDGGVNWQKIRDDVNNELWLLAITADPDLTLYNLRYAPNQDGTFISILYSSKDGRNWQKRMQLDAFEGVDLMHFDSLNPKALHLAARIFRQMPATKFVINPKKTPFQTGLVNVSTRGWVGQGEQTLRAGFIIKGSQPRTLLIKGEGAIMNVRNAITNPRLSVKKIDGTEVTSNDNWRDSIDGGLISLLAKPAADAEAALITTLAPGLYVAELSNVDTQNGQGLIGVTDVRAFLPPPDAETQHGQGLINLSTRGWIGSTPESNMMTAGFIIRGQQPVRVLVKAEGPILGTPDALADPLLRLTRLDGEFIAKNDNWQDHPTAREVAKLAPPSNDKESALIVELPPGIYLATLQSANNAEGLGLLAITDVRAFADLD